MKQQIENLINLANQKLGEISNKIATKRDNSDEDGKLFLYWATRIQTFKEVLQLIEQEEQFWNDQTVQ